MSIAIVTYNSEKHIGKLLDSIASFVKGIDYHVYVIDNNSVDGTAEIVRSKASHTTLIQLEQNIGFGAAHNKVLDKIDSRYHVIVNPDIYFDYDILAAMAAYMDKNPDIGLVSPKVLYPDGRVQMLPKKDPRFIYLLSRRLNFGFLKKYRDRYEMALYGEDKPYDIEFASGCFMFLRTDLYRKAGGFDERYFLYFEDADLSRSLRKLSKIQYNPDFYLYHHWERGGAKKAGLFLLQVKSMFKYISKWRKSGT